MVYKTNYAKLRRSWIESRQGMRRKATLSNTPTLRDELSRIWHLKSRKKCGYSEAILNSIHIVFVISSDRFYIHRFSLIYRWKHHTLNQNPLVYDVLDKHVESNGIKAGKEKAGIARVMILSNIAIPNLASIPKITAELYLNKNLLAVKWINGTFKWLS